MVYRTFGWSIGLAAALCFYLVAGTTAQAQLLRNRRARPPESEAIVGEPFGVGRISVRLADARPGFFGERDFLLREANGRAFYAAFESQPVRAILREVLNRPQDVTVYFLFTGKEPLELELLAPEPVRIRVVPHGEPVAHGRLLGEWWRQYTEAARRAARTDEYPQLVDSYLLSMLSQRLRLPLPDIDRSLFPQAEIDNSLGVLLGTESMRLQVQQRVMSSVSTQGPADEPLPKPLGVAESIAPNAPDVKIEDIAAHVPEECFYIRFGNFPNYLWFSRLLTEYGGELRNLIAMRGVDYQLNRRQEQQLVLKESALAEVLGPQVIADVALVGQDMFLREGAAIGILFQARNNFGLSTDIRSQRAAALQANKDATEATVEIAGHKVSFVSTPDNRIRSFYAVDGDFHFVTTSQTMVRRFYDAGAGKGALGQTSEFRQARREMPLERDDSVLAYFSTAFFERLLSPQYHIEMQRRLRSAAEIDLVKMARLAAENEARPHETIDDLVRGDFLPHGFGRRANGSQLVLERNGEVLDSLRGGSGSFAPVCDIDFDRVTSSEAGDYRSFASEIYDHWQRVDPIVLAAKRFSGETPQLERVALTVRMTPLAEKNYATLMNFAGAPSSDRMAPIDGNIATVEAVTRGRGPEPIHLYAGVLDTGVSPSVVDDLLGGLRALMNLKFYFGGWPSAGMFSFFGLRDNLPVGPDGFGRASAFLWQRTDGPFVTGSTDPDVLANVTPQFRIAKAERPAQLWLQLGDLNRSELATLINGYGYFRARQITGGDLRFVHRMMSQLGVPAEKAKATAEDLVGGRLLCALGGEYKLARGSDGAAEWYSTAWDRNASRLITSVPRGFTTPPLDWLRSAELDASLTREMLSADALITMQRRAPATATAPNATPTPVGESKLPAFSFPGLDWFGGKNGSTNQESAKAPPVEEGTSQKLPPQKN